MKIIKMIKSEYTGWIFNARILLMPCVFILIYSFVTKNLLAYSDRMGTPINLLEPFIGICNSPQLLGLIPIVFLVLISDFPRVDNNMIYKIFRAGRRKWLISQLLFLLFADISFVFLLFIGVTLPIADSGFLFNGWSDVVTEMNQKMPELSSTFTSKLIPPNLYYQMLPYAALIYSVLLLVLYLYLLGGLLLVLKLIGHKILGVVVTGFVLVLGTGLAQFQLPIQWIFPASHGLLQSHFSSYFRELYCPLEYSVFYFLLLIFLLVFTAFWYAPKISYTKIIQIN